MEIINEKILLSKYKNMKIFDAKMKIASDFPNVKVDVEYSQESSEKKVLDCKYDSKNKVVKFICGTGSFVGVLPMIYQENLFLEEFALVFQHIMNSVDETLDNIDVYFNPMKTPKFFLPVLAQWFQLDLTLLGSDDKVVRKIIQYAIPLYKLRGTAKGLRLLLFLISGVMPEIHEGVIPFSEMCFSSQVEINSFIFGNLKKEFVFYIYFPVLESDMDENLVKRLHLIVQREKPAYMRAYICFKAPPKFERKVTTFTPGMEEMGEEGVVF